jgi:hypothetical protein
VAVGDPLGDPVRPDGDSDGRSKRAARPALEIEGASALAREGTDLVDAAGPSGVPRELDLGSRSRAGNPLGQFHWAPCLQPDRPLFSVSRRPPFAAAAIAARRQSRRPLRLLPRSGVAYASWDNCQPEGKRCDP